MTPAEERELAALEAKAGGGGSPMAPPAWPKGLKVPPFPPAPMPGPEFARQERLTGLGLRGQPAGPGQLRPRPRKRPTPTPQPPRECFACPV